METGAQDIEREAHRLLAALLELPAEGREELLFASTATGSPLRSLVEKLLRAADSSASFLETPAWRGAELDGRFSAAEPGAKIGQFTLLERAGVGGMGDVFRAEQASPKRIVALKLIRGRQPTANALRRFAMEAEALGRLQHPNIAQVIEAQVIEAQVIEAQVIEAQVIEAQVVEAQLVEAERSVSAPILPYVAMEWIEGARSFLTFVNEERLSVDQRLRRFLLITDAITHAHGRGVIHRDLKPENILVGRDGVVKVIDFGVALLADGRSRATLDRQFVGSLGSMSPEQCDGRDIDVRTDVYALGTLLFELVEGHPPFDLAALPIAQAIETIRSVRAPKAHSAGSDLAKVISKALAKRPEDRYLSVEAMARDIGNVLNHRPVEAARASVGHRLRLLSRRHRSALAAGLVAAMAILGGATALTIGFVRAQAAEAETSRRNKELARVSEFLRSLIANDNFDRGKATRTIESELDGWAQRIEKEFADMPWARAGLRREIGRNLAAVGRYADAQPVLEAALEDYRLAGPAFTTEVIVTRGTIARMLRDAGDTEAALAAYATLIPEAIAAIGEDPVHVDVIRGDYAMLLNSLRRTDEADAILQAVLDNRVAKLGRDNFRTAATLGHLGRVRFAQQRDADAERLYREAIAIEDGIEGSLLAAASTRNNLATVLRRQGRDEEARALYREVYDIRLREQGPDDPDALIVQQNLGSAALTAGDHAEASRILADCYERHVRVLGASKRGTVITGLALLRAHIIGESWDAALAMAPSLRAAIEAAQPQFGTSTWRTAWCDCLHGKALLELDRRDEGRPLLEQGIHGLEKSNEPDAIRNLAKAREWLPTEAIPSSPNGGGGSKGQ